MAVKEVVSSGVLTLLIPAARLEITKWQVSWHSRGKLHEVSLSLGPQVGFTGSGSKLSKPSVTLLRAFVIVLEISASGKYFL